MSLSTSLGQDGESERRTRRQRIDPRLRALGWELDRFDPARPLASYQRHAIEEYPTNDGPADYALFVDGRALGIVEAKKLGLGAQNVLTQAERYSRGVTASPFDFDGFRVPFIYATNGETTWFRDVRHTQNLSRPIVDFHTPAALAELIGRDAAAECQALATIPNDHSRLRPYQIEANIAVEHAIANRKRQMLVAMATGTGKTFTMVNQAYRLMKAGVGRRILFLVDRRALAAQAVQAFASFEPEPGLKFNKIYEVYSQQLARGDADEDVFNPVRLPRWYAEDPRPGHAYVYVSTIQGLAHKLFGRQAAAELGDEPLDDDEDDLWRIPLHAFDVVIADECHRGYSTAAVSFWRKTLDHFDAVKIGLTATPAAHTKAYFSDIVFRYEYERAVREGFLVDYDVVTINSDVHLNGLFLHEGEHVDIIDPTDGSRQLDFLEDERGFDASEIEQKITAPAINQRIVEEVKRYTDDHAERYGRFPKTLIFAANDLPHTSHADNLVGMARNVFGRGDAFVRKITGQSARPLRQIREFRNHDEPGVVVSVDMLTTGVDIPDLEFIVFLRPVKSRILFEQMLGRGTRLGSRYPDKSHFTVFDGFAGTLLAYFRNTTGITAEPPEQATRPVNAIIEDIWQNRDRDYNIRVLVKRLQRIDKQMAGDARDDFSAYIPNGDVAAFAAGLPRLLRDDFTATTATLRADGFQDLLVNYRRPPRTFIVAHEAEGAVSSEWLVRGADGREYKPEDYLAAFARWVLDNTNRIDAIRILLDRPRDWSTDALEKLRHALTAAPQHFTLDHLQQAHRLRHDIALADIISMVKHAADEHQPLLTAEEQVGRAVERLGAGRDFTEEQRGWLERIRAYLVQSLSIAPDDFDEIPVFTDRGGWGRANRAFGGCLSDLLHQLNEAIAA